MIDWQAGVLEQLRASGRKPLKIRDLAERLAVQSEADRQALKAVVHQMAAEGRIEQVHGKRFGLPRTPPIVGKLIGHRDGYAFVRPEDAEDGAPDIYINEEDRLGAMHGDRVAVRTVGGGRFGRVRGQVTTILTRARTTVVGTLRSRGRTLAVVPQDTRLFQQIRIPADGTGGAVDGQRVVCELTEYPTAYAEPVGCVIEVLGFAGEPGVDTRVILRKHEWPEEFAEEVLVEAAATATTVTEAECTGRLDLRDLPTVTIDGADAKDLDDAVSLEDLGQGRVRLGVHIADVSHYVKPGTALDEAAFERATSVYLSDLVVPMLPHELSNGICSLNAGVDRLAMSCLMDLDREGQVTQYTIRPSVIRVDHRMTYDAVFEILEDPASPLRDEYGEWTARFEALGRLAACLRDRRVARGSIMFEFPEARAEIDEHGGVESITLRTANRAHHLIEEFMVAANETVARHMRDLDAPFMYRIHESPESDALDRFLDFVNSLGFRVTATMPVEPRDLQAICNMVKGAPEEQLVNTLMLRSLKQARYAADNAGHFGLASRCYCHFTSPIRRYPDLMVHRLLYLVDERGVDAAREKWGRRLEGIAEQCSERERVAMAAERESLRVKQLLYMQDRVGDVFAARVTGVQRYGMFVQTVQELAEGLVHISELQDDYYELVEEEHCLAGANTGRRFTLGDALRVQVMRVDIEEQELDFRVMPPDPADEEANPDPPRQHRRKVGNRNNHRNHGRRGGAPGRRGRRAR